MAGCGTVFLFYNLQKETLLQQRSVFSSCQQFGASRPPRAAAINMTIDHQAAASTMNPVTACQAADVLNDLVTNKQPDPEFICLNAFTSKGFTLKYSGDRDKDPTVRRWGHSQLKTRTAVMTLAWPSGQIGKIVSAFNIH